MKNSTTSKSPRAAAAWRLTSSAFTAVASAMPSGVTLPSISARARSYGPQVIVSLSIPPPRRARRRPVGCDRSRPRLGDYQRRLPRRAEPPHVFALALERVERAGREGLGAAQAAGVEQHVGRL